MISGAEYAQIIIVNMSKITSFLIISPFFSTIRIPVSIRLVLSIVLSFVAVQASMLSALEIEHNFDQRSPFLLRLVEETIIGATFGIIVRIIHNAMESLGEVVSSFIGLTNIFSSFSDESSASNTFAFFCSIKMLVLLFIVDIPHLCLLVLLTHNIDIANGWNGLGNEVISIYLDVLKWSFGFIVQMTLPVSITSLSINFAAGYVNRLIPQAPIYFVVIPLTITLGIYVAAIAMMDAPKIAIEKIMKVTG